MILYNLIYNFLTVHFIFDQDFQILTLKSWGFGVFFRLLVFFFFFSIRLKKNLMTVFSIVY